MHKKEFLLEMEQYLKKLPKNEREDILQDYNEYFLMGEAEGKAESQIVESLGPPKQLSKELLANFHIGEMEKTLTTQNIFRAVWAAIGLGFVNLVLILGPFLVLLVLLVAGWTVGIAGMISPILVVINFITNPGVYEWFDAFFSITLCGMGLFISMGLYYVTLWIKKGSLRYLKYNVSVVKGGNKYD